MIGAVTGPGADGRAALVRGGTVLDPAQGLHARRDVRLRALPDVIEILKSEKDGQVRLTALDIVTFLGPDAEPAIDALVHTLKTNYGGQGKEEATSWHVARPSGVRSDSDVYRLDLIATSKTLS